MKKSYKLVDLDCADCALKMEQKISEIEGVKDVKISFMSSRLVLEADETLFSDILDKAAKVIKSIEPDCSLAKGF